MRLLQTANPNDVRFYFPKTESELWANSGVLSDASPYFKALLKSEFQEGRFLTSAARREGANGKGKRKASELDVGEDGDGVDSDAETDNSHPPTRVGAESDALNPFHQIEITSASHTTYAALLGYLYTSHVSFAPLRSSSSTLRFVPSTTSLPHPVSPKSLYRLSHFVGVPALSKLCLDRIRESLTVDNVAKELFGETPRLYPDVKEVMLTFAAANWNLVLATLAFSRFFPSPLLNNPAPALGFLSLSYSPNLDASMPSNPLRNNTIITDSDGHRAVGHPTYNALDRIYTPSDQGLLLRHSVLKGIQTTALAAPPLILLLRFRRPIPIMRTYATMTFVLGGLTGLTVGMMRTLNMTDAGLSSRAERLRMKVGMGREDEMSIVGAGIGAALGATYFPRRIPLPSRILGGGALGVGLGVATHLLKNHLDGTLDETERGVLGMWEELKAGILGTDKIPPSEDDKKREMEASEFWSPGFEGI
ncbi:hypothetical protein RQP46_006141 [Phenoliferia psychrophenolica]